LNHIQKLYRVEKKIKDKTAEEKKVAREKDGLPRLCFWHVDKYPLTRQKVRDIYLILKFFGQQLLLTNRTITFEQTKIPHLGIPF